MRIIVSCTTTKDRQIMLRYFLHSLMQQSLQPDLVLVNVSTEPYLQDDGIVEAPELQLPEHFLFQWVENTGPYRKLLPAIEAAEEDDLVITADDDVLYANDWIENLVSVAVETPDAIIAPRARTMKSTLWGGWKNYSLWEPVGRTTKGTWLLPIGAGGVLYRKALLDQSFLFDRAFLELAPTNDDLWFRMSSLRAKAPVYVVPSIDQGTMYLKHAFALTSQNMNTKSGGRRMTRMPAKILNELKNQLGINISTNDHAWDRIMKYSTSHS